MLIRCFFFRKKKLLIIVIILRNQNFKFLRKFNFHFIVIVSFFKIFKVNKYL